MRTPNYFIWKGTDSRAMGVHVIKYPPIMRAPERLKYVAIPGRSGDLTLAEGNQVYDAYIRTMEISNMRGADVNMARAWLSGTGPLILGNEPDYVYTVDMQAQLQMDKILRGVWGGSLQMHTQPFKAKTVQPADIEIDSTATMIFNPGTVPAEPTVRLYAGSTAAATVTLGGKTLTFSSMPELLVIDLETQWIFDGNGARVTNIASGDFGKIPPGRSIVNFTGSITKVVIIPKWRYL